VEKVTQLRFRPAIGRQRSTATQHQTQAEMPAGFADFDS
jgi:hypothetical protein